MLAAVETSSRSSLLSHERGYVVPTASDPTVASRASVGGATADGTAGLSYRMILNSYINNLMSRFKK